MRLVKRIFEVYFQYANAYTRTVVSRVEAASKLMLVTAPVVA